MTEALTREEIQSGFRQQIEDAFGISGEKSSPGTAGGADSREKVDDRIFEQAKEAFGENEKKIASGRNRVHEKWRAISGILSAAASRKGELRDSEVGNFLTQRGELLAKLLEAGKLSMEENSPELLAFLAEHRPGILSIQAGISEDKLRAEHCSYFVDSVPVGFAELVGSKIAELLGNEIARETKAEAREKLTGYSAEIGREGNPWACIQKLYIKNAENFGGPDNPDEALLERCCKFYLEKESENRWLKKLGIEATDFSSIAPDAKKRIYEDWQRRTFRSLSKKMGTEKKVFADLTSEQKTEIWAAAETLLSLYEHKKAQGDIKRGGSVLLNGSGKISFV